MAMTEEEKKLTAYHEAGHAITRLNVPWPRDPVHKATIIPRGRALGMVMQLPEGDRYSMSYKWMTSRLAIMMGGRVAEEITFGKENITSGAVVRHRAGHQAFAAPWSRNGASPSELLDQVAYGENQDEVFLGMSSPAAECLGGDGAEDRHRGPPPGRRGLYRGTAVS
jgi:cell division protease FtsH